MYDMGIPFPGETFSLWVVEIAHDHELAMSGLVWTAWSTMSENSHQ